MITKKTIIIATTMLLTTTATLQAFKLHNPLSECNAKQAHIMKSKCNKLSGLEYSLCERETLEEFFKCTTPKKEEQATKQIGEQDE